MAHIQQKVFISELKNKYNHFFKNKKVLDVGSLDINGSMREFFEHCNYTGIDVGEGKGVDIVCQGQDYDAPDESFDVVCSAECFEHNPYWFETFENMIRMCKKGGLLFFTCATEGRPEHGTSRTTPDCSPLTVELGWTYYQNLTEQDLTERLNLDDHFSSYEFSINSETCDLYFWGIKKDKNPSIPLIGTAVVTSAFWVSRLIYSVDFPVDEFVIFNNNGRGELEEELNALTKINHKFIKKIKVCHLPSNIGCPGAWNMIIKCYMNAPYWVIVNDDVAFEFGALEKMYNYAQEPDVGVVHGSCGNFDLGSWELFLIKDWVIQEYGLFDENLYPAYCEDCDYIMRFAHKPVKKKFLIEHPDDQSMYKHGFGPARDYESQGGQTKRSDNELWGKLEYANDRNIEYLTEKWGEHWRTCWPTEHPYDNKSIPLSYTKYDLSFVRSKHLGF
jgi:SAM-dependent methyltransferase